MSPSSPPPQTGGSASSSGVPAPELSSIPVSWDAAPTKMPMLGLKPTRSLTSQAHRDHADDSEAARAGPTAQVCWSPAPHPPPTLRSIHTQGRAWHLEMVGFMGPPHPPTGTTEEMLPGSTPPNDSGSPEAASGPTPRQAPAPRRHLPEEKQPPTQPPAEPAPDTAPPGPGPARRAHAPSPLTPRHLHKQGAKHPRAHAPGTRRHRRTASPQRLARARAHAATRGHTRRPLPPQGVPRPPIRTPRTPALRETVPPGSLAGGGAELAAPNTPPGSGAVTSDSSIPSPSEARTGPGSHPPRPAHLAQVRRPLALGPQTLTGPAPLRGRPSAPLLRLREPGPPARHISRSRGGGTSATGQKCTRKKCKKSGLHRSNGGPLGGGGSGLGARGSAPLPGREAGETAGGGGVTAPGAGARRSPPRRRRQRATSPPQLAAPTEAARARPGDFPAPSDGGHHGLSGAAGTTLQSPAVRQRRSGARAAPSAGASSADGGRGRRSADSSRADGSGSPQWPGGSGLEGGGAEQEQRPEAGTAASRPGEAGGGPPGGGHRRTRRPSRRRAPAMTSRLLAPLPGAPAPGGGAGARKTRPGTTDRDRPLQPAWAHRGQPENPGWMLCAFASSCPLGKRGEEGRRAGSSRQNGEGGGCIVAEAAWAAPIFLAATCKRDGKKRAGIWHERIRSYRLHQERPGAHSDLCQPPVPRKPLGCAAAVEIEPAAGLPEPTRPRAQARPGAPRPASRRLFPSPGILYPEPRDPHVHSVLRLRHPRSVHPASRALYPVPRDPHTQSAPRSGTHVLCTLGLRHAVLTFALCPRPLSSVS
ncbi:collagen alpha-1(III) chain-like [Loxodonta africana]|uniref:collagen alpha-1(III) chain-like n=1 Tax=Loxodonta africana TaxID=9785 RepID=UPI0030CD6EE5